MFGRPVATTLICVIPPMPIANTNNYNNNVFYTREGEKKKEVGEMRGERVCVRVSVCVCVCVCACLQYSSQDSFKREINFFSGNTLSLSFPIDLILHEA